MSAQQIYMRIEEKIRTFQPTDPGFVMNPSHFEPELIHLIEQELANVDPLTRKQVEFELFNWGPLMALLPDQDITEILVNGPDEIWFEKGGTLRPYLGKFSTPLSYQSFLNRVCFEAGKHYSLENPFCDGCVRGFRFHFCAQVISQKNHVLSLRRQAESPWTLSRLQELSWASIEQLDYLQNAVANRANFLVVGPTGSGKTAILNALMNSISKNDRCIIIEDTAELKKPNGSSVSLLTRKDPNGLLPAIDQAELVRHSLRMRPDRLIIGEVRGTEAKDLLLALSTGHSGSMGTLHASSASQALIRLEMLVQMGAPQWSLQTVRNLIGMSLNYILVAHKNALGQRRILALEKIASVEETGILLEKII